VATESSNRSGLGLFKGSAGLIVALAVVAILLLALPAYRWFFLISFVIGLIIWRGLALWYRLRPIKDEEIENKRPLGL
jgi:MFS family permease